MARILELLPEERLTRLLSQYSELLGEPVFLLGPDKTVIIKTRGNETGTKHRLVPVYLRDTLEGYVCVNGKGGSDGLACVADNLSEMMESAYEVESLSGEVARTYEELAMLWRLSSRLGPGLDSDKVCRVLADEVMILSPSTNVSIMLVVEAPGQAGAAGGEPRNFFIPRVSIGRDASRASAAAFSTGVGLLGHVHKTMKAITVCDVTVDERFEGFPFPVNRVLIVPMIVDNAVIGVIVATDRLDGEEYFSPEIKLLTGMASQCAISIKKALLYDELREMLFATAEAFSFAIDAKDPYTYGHSKRVAEKAVKIASDMGLDIETKGKLRIAALLHDVGKIGVPEAVLNKDGKLDTEGMEKIQAHPRIGARMLGRIRKFKDIALWVEHHHEHFDGTGYPDGLKGVEIPIVSRIITAADFHDALITDRPYRKALGEEEALAIMHESSGVILDPEVLASLERRGVS